MMFFRLLPLKAWLAIGAVALVLALWGAYSWQKARADRAEARLAPVTASRDALDRVAVKTDEIRSEQQEKQGAIEKIEGSDVRLPDGYGRLLECVRRGERDCDSR